MINTQTEISWNVQALTKYEIMIASIPIFHRNIAKQVVDIKAVEFAIERGADQVEEEDIVKSFLTEVPKAFYSLMVRLLDQSGFDYQKYSQ